MGAQVSGSQAQFWIFSLDLYGDSDVRKSCLHLQDAFGADVNMLLWCCHCAWDFGRICETPELEAIDLSLKQWREDMLIPLRSLRKKASVDRVFYEALKAAELEGERYAQNLIVNSISAADEQGLISQGTRLSYAHQSLRNYLVGYLGLSDGKVSEVIATLLSGLSRLSNEHPVPSA